MTDKKTRREVLKITGAGGVATGIGVGTVGANRDGNGSGSPDDNGNGPPDDSGNGPPHGGSDDGPFDVIVGMEPGNAAEAENVAEEVKRVLDFGRYGEAVSGVFTEEALRGLEGNPNVRYVEENGTMEALGETVPYGIEITDADEAIDDGETGEEVSVAILDTGIDAQHETLEKNLGDGWAATAAECDTSSDCDPGFFCPSNEIDTCYEEWDDDSDHGTHVAGTAAAAMNDTGVKGVAPDATLHAVKVLDCCGSGDFDDIAAGIEWATDQGHDVINMSLGGPESDAVNDAVDYAASNNVVLVAAAGNDGECEDCVNSPADNENVIAVSATDENDDLASFSSTGPEVELAAPGVDTLSTIPRDDYEEFDGTSMASPHVAGAAASVIASGVTNREDVRDALKEGAEDIGLDDNEQGAGRLNVANSIETDDDDDDDGDDDDDEDVSIDIQTDPASGVGETTATLNGELLEFEGTDEVDVWFEYGQVGSGFPESTGTGTFEETTAFSSDVSGLSEGTDYEYRAHGEANGVEETGGVQTFTTDEDDDGGWCFITTATAREPQTLNSLRRFRDESMSATPLGRGLVGLYYRISPPIAKTLERHPESYTADTTRSIIQTCATLSDAQDSTDSRTKSVFLGVVLTVLYVVGILTAATGHAGITLRERL